MCLCTLLFPCILISIPILWAHYKQCEFPLIVFNINKFYLLTYACMLLFEGYNYYRMLGHCLPFQ